ncbi:NFACT RNA binding domain-containing protein [Candidatus Undinarchaeota archaeon]
MVKAIGLVSGGLDSTLAVKLVQAQGIEVVGVNFITPFTSSPETAERISKELGIEVRAMYADEDYVELLKKPAHGFGKNMNPCIDCRAYYLKKAKKIADAIEADFIFTGEVLGQRPMSQQRGSMNAVEKTTGLEGKIVRPMCAKLLPESEAEKKGLIDREKLLDIEGRTRRRQLELVEKMGIEKYETPAGGCLLTEVVISKRLRDLLRHKPDVKLNEMWILKFGRHFRVGENKIIVGRNKEDNEKLMEFKLDEDYWLEVQEVGSPIVILQGPKTEDSIETAAKFAAKYSDSEEESVKVDYWIGEEKKGIEVAPFKIDEIERFII